ncbi:MAG: ABC transporter permease [Acidobacteriaceae bacterium]|nr:ABC transporter permease [Acidobacteriaceae bacterium]MBV8569846.1 ABC transporter permease [Acidobacteriaceae bacterium]
MAVYKRSYRSYSGPMTPAWSRFLVLYRASRRALFRSRGSTAFFVLCFFFPLLCVLGVYANSNLAAISFLGERASQALRLDINGTFFLVYLTVQSTLSFILTAFIGPGLISPDLANGALTLYLSRPMSRAEYVLGKCSVLFIILSEITWVPGLVIFAVQASLAGWHWASHNMWIATGIFLGSLIWILVLSLLAMALSAWVKWRIAAGAFLLAVFFMGGGFAQAINSVLRTKQGYLLDISNLVSVIWRDLLRAQNDASVPAGEAWVAVLAFVGLCLLLLVRKLKANEVVR